MQNIYMQPAWDPLIEIHCFKLCINLYLLIIFHLKYFGWSQKNMYLALFFTTKYKMYYQMYSVLILLGST